jgi:hypothetical protein
LGAVVLVFAVVSVVALGIRALPMLQASVAIVSAPGELFVGDSLQLAVEGEAEGVSWSSSDTSVVSVARGEALFRAVGAGTAVLSAQAGSRSDSVSVTVRWPVIGSLAISPPPDLRVGDSHALSAAVADVAGRAIASAKPSWSSETPAIVLVDENGVALGVKPGRGRITARLDTATAAVDILVLASQRSPTDGGTANRPPPPAASPVRGEPAIRAATTDAEVRTAAADEELRAAPAGAEPRTAPTDEDLRTLASQCTEALANGNRVWIVEHYDAVTPGDHENLRKLEEVLGRTGLTFAVQETHPPRREESRIDFRVEFSYRSFFGGSVRAGGTFRMIAEAVSGSWRLGSCRVVGDFRVG